MSSATGLPIASSRDQPKICSARGFQKVTRPVASMLMTASRAVSSTARMCEAVSRRRSRCALTSLTLKRSWSRGPPRPAGGG